MADEVDIVDLDTSQVVAVPTPEKEVVSLDDGSPVAVEVPTTERVSVEQDSTVLDESTDVHVVSVGDGVPGPRGAPGSGTEVTKTAGVDLGGHRIVVVDDAGLLDYANSTNMLHFAKVLGMTTGAVAAGASATVATGGEITEPSWNWTLDQEVFLGTNGQMTQTPPSTGFSITIGFPTAATKLFIKIGTPIVL